MTILPTPPNHMAPLSASPAALATTGSEVALFTALDAHGFWLTGPTISLRGESGSVYLSSAHHPMWERRRPTHRWTAVDTGTVLDGSQGPVVVIVRQTTGRARVNRSRGRPSRAAVLAEATATTDRLLAALAHARIPTLVDHQHGTMLRHRIPDVPYGLRTLMNDLGKPHSAQVQLAPVLSAWLAGGQLDAHDPDLVAACSHAYVQLYWLEQVDHLVRYQEQLTDADLGRLALVGANDNPAAGDLVTADLRTLPGDRLCRVGQYVEARCAQVSARRPWYETF